MAKPTPYIVNEIRSLSLSSAAMNPTPSSSSTLSPLAPPFIADPFIADWFNNGDHRRRIPPLPRIADLSGNGSLDAEKPSPAKSAGESSSWVDPSLSYNYTSLKRGVAGSSSENGDAYGPWHGKHVDFSARPVHIRADSSAWRDELATAYKVKARDSCNNGLSYLQLSTDPIVCYPPTTCSSSANGFTPETSSQLHFLPRNSYSTTQHENLLDNIDDNFFNHKLGNKKVLGMDQYSDSKDVHAKDGIADNNMKGTTWNFSMDKTCPSLGNEVTTANSLGYSTEVTYEFGTKQLNFMESIASSSRPKNSLQISSEILDQPNLAVDSPCWKGASMSQKYSFGSGVKDSGKGSQGLNGNGNQLSQLTAISSPERPLLETEGGNAETVVTDATQDKPSSPNLDSEDHIRSSSETRPVFGSAAKPIGTGLLLQAMDSLSEALLSSSYGGGVEWKECDHELVRSVINNLEAFTSRNRKVSVSKSNDTSKKPTNTSSEEKNQGKKNEMLDIGSNGITEVTMEDLENDIFAKKEENPQVLLYKNLWMQAEAALCSMKYELQLARMTLEMEKNDYETEEKDPVQLTKSPVFMAPMHSDTSYSVENNGGKSSEPKQKEQQTSRDNRIEDSVLARLEIIKGRHSNQKTLA